VSTTVVEPFALRLDFETGALGGHTSRIERRASALRGAVADAKALEALVAAGDLVVYQVEQRDVPEEVGQLICCTTVIQPGAVGDEYFMTKGHYHADRDTGEVYLGLSGVGLLLLQSGEESAELPMQRGTVAYVPPGWAHRTVNTGETPFVFFAVYPGQAGHDYAGIEAAGFVHRVLRTPEGPVVVEREPS
jgi:glucose-6-phosphate isomerase